MYMSFTFPINNILNLIFIWVLMKFDKYNAI